MQPLKIRSTKINLDIHSFYAYWRTKSNYIYSPCYEHLASGFVVRALTVLVSFWIAISSSSKSFTEVWQKSIQEVSICLHSQIYSVIEWGRHGFGALRRPPFLFHSLQYLEYSNEIEDINPELPVVCCDHVEFEIGYRYTLYVRIRVQVHVLVNLLLDRVIGHFITPCRIITSDNHRK